MIRIYHNPRCSKSRQTLALLTGRGVDPEVIEYLKTGPTESEIRDLLSKLGLNAVEVVRRGEKVFKELGLSKDSDEDALIAAMASNPILIERPIVVNGDKAAIGRPPEAVLDVL